LAGTLPSTRDEDGYYFVDRGGELFHLILAFLRQGRLPLLSVEQRQLIAEDAEFYQIDLPLPLSCGEMLRSIGPWKQRALDWFSDHWQDMEQLLVESATQGNVVYSFIFKKKLYHPFTFSCPFGAFEESWSRILFYDELKHLIESKGGLFVRYSYNSVSHNARVRVCWSADGHIYEED